MPGSIIVPIVEPIKPQVKRQNISDPRTCVHTPKLDTKIPVHVFVRFDAHVVQEEIIEDGKYRLESTLIEAKEFGSEIMIDYNRKDTDEEIIEKVKATKEYTDMLDALNITDKTDPEKVHITIDITIVPNYDE